MDCLKKYLIYTGVNMVDNKAFILISLSFVILIALLIWNVQLTNKVDQLERAAGKNVETTSKTPSSQVPPSNPKISPQVENTPTTTKSASNEFSLPSSSTSTELPSYSNFPSTDCEDNLSIESVSEDGSIIKLDDGSIWEVDSLDTIDTSLWLAYTDILVCNDKMINTDDNEKVGVTKLR